MASAGPKTVPHLDRRGDRTALGPLDLLLTERTVSAEEAERIGLIKQLVEPGRPWSELSGEREQRGSLRDESERARVRVDELDGAVAAEQARAAELERSRVRAEARVSELEAELADVQAGLEEHQLSAETLEAASSAPQSNGLK